MEIFKAGTGDNPSMVYMDGHQKVMLKYGFPFCYSVPRSYDIDEMAAKVRSATEPVLDRYQDVVEDGSCWINRHDGIALHFRAVCFSDEEVGQIESDVETALNEAGIEFRKHGPDRCANCGRAVRAWDLVPASRRIRKDRDVEEILGCPYCHAPAPE